MQWQTAASLYWQGGSSGDLIPQPNGRFDYAYMGNRMRAIYTGSPADGAKYTEIGLSIAPYRNRARPVLNRPLESELGSSGSSSNGRSWAHQLLDLGDKGDIIWLSGGGTSFDWERDGDWIPDRIAADLYLNGELAAELTLLPVEGGVWSND